MNNQPRETRIRYTPHYIREGHVESAFHYLGTSLSHMEAAIRRAQADGVPAAPLEALRDSLQSELAKVRGLLSPERLARVEERERQEVGDEGETP